jgi:hypothetical protein
MLPGRVGWGISWYINGLLIPEIYLVRGKTYTFVVEGGNDPNQPASYHPFYISDDPEGGYEHKTPEQRKKVILRRAYLRYNYLARMIVFWRLRVCAFFIDLLMPNPIDRFPNSIQVRVLAGIENGPNGAQPTGVGRLCEWKEDGSEPASSFTSFGAYQRSLTLQCQEGQPGIIQFRPDENTPDTLYYSCYTHRYQHCTFKFWISNIY